MMSVFRIVHLICKNNQNILIFCFLDNVLEIATAFLINLHDAQPSKPI